MDEDELRNWSIYLRDQTPDVAELQMAVLSNIIISYMGKKNSKYTDFLIRKQNDSTSTDELMSNDAILNAFQSMGAK